jgi:hypothetical protein
MASKGQFTSVLDVFLEGSHCMVMMLRKRRKLHLERATAGPSGAAPEKKNQLNPNKERSSSFPNFSEDLTIEHLSMELKRMLKVVTVG